MTIEFHKRYFITEKLAKDLTQLSSAMYAESHPELEINNPKPLFVALGIKKPMSMQEKMERLFAGPQGLIQQMYDQGEETPEDFNDLDIIDDVEPISPYEYVPMQEEKITVSQPPADAAPDSPAEREPDDAPQPSGAPAPDAETSA